MKDMIRLAACLLILSSGATISAKADEQKIALNELPKPVRRAVETRYPKALMIEAAKETEDGKTVYEVTLKDGMAKIDVSVTPTGVLELIERSMDAKKLPPSVAKTLEAKYPKAAYKIVEQVIKVADGKETLDFYEVLLVTASDEKETLEVQISPKGEIKKTETKGEGEAGEEDEAKEKETKEKAVKKASTPAPAKKKDQTR